MGKYQLDAKGKKSVEKFHENNSSVSAKNSQKAKIEALRAKVAGKKTNKKA